MNPLNNFVFCIIVPLLIMKMTAINAHVPPPVAGKSPVVRVAKTQPTSTQPSAYTTLRKLNFVQDVVPILTKQGCANGSCHGSPQGKGSFSLSLFGYDPTMDKRALTRDSLGRRIDTFVPDNSLILKKPMLRLPHLGGRRIVKSDVAYTVLRTWIAQGADATLSNVEATRIEIIPATSQVLKTIGKRVPLRVIATFSDGTKRDVTPIATFQSAHLSVANVSEGGTITGVGRGQTAISIRYLQHLESIPVKVLDPVRGYVWKPVVENNVVDRIVNQTLKDLNVTAAQTCTDGTFIRRVTLDLTGLLPSGATARAFTESKDPQKRRKTIDAILESDAFARFWALKRADLLRVTNQRMPHGGAARLTAWLAEGWRTNRPADVEAQALLASDGDTTTLAPVNYMVAVTTPEDRTEMAAQTFMGTRINCAKCHNHPYEKWTMNDYYSISAAFARTETNGFTVVSTKTGETKHPTKDRIMAPYGAKTGEEPANRRVSFANWLTSPSNPLFAKTEVNRMWAELFGRGIVHPVDDLRTSNPPSNAALLDMLTRRLIATGYDRKAIIRLICNSQTYQRSADTDTFNAADEVLFSHAKPRLMSAEQLIDSVGLMTGTIVHQDGIANEVDILSRQINALRTARQGQFKAFVDEEKSNLAKQDVVLEPWLLHTYVERTESDALTLASVRSADATKWTTRDDIADNKDVRFGHVTGGVYWIKRTIVANGKQTITMNVAPADRVSVFVNDTEVPRGVQDSRVISLRSGENTVTIQCRMPDANQPVRIRVTDACRVPIAIREPLRLSMDTSPALRLAFDRLDATLRHLLEQLTVLEARDQYATQRFEPRPTEFLAAFGQPKRESACACERQSNPTLLQALELLNGSETAERLNGVQKTYKNLSDTELVGRIYLAAFSRNPSPKEEKMALGFLQKNTSQEQARVDFVWAILGTKEFLFQH